MAKKAGGTKVGNLLRKVSKPIKSAIKTVDNKSQGASALTGAGIAGSLQKAQANANVRTQKDINTFKTQTTAAKNAITKANIIRGGTTGILSTLANQGQGSKVSSAMAKFTNRPSVSSGSPRNSIRTSSDNMTPYEGLFDGMGLKGNNMNTRSYTNTGSYNASGGSTPRSNVINAPEVLTPNNAKFTFPEPIPTDYSSDIPPILSPADKQAKEGKNLLQEQMNALLGDFNERTTVSDIERQLNKQLQIRQKQERVSALTEQLNSIVSKGQANQLAIVGQGRGIPEAIIGGQQAEIGRETAIAALPVQAQLSAAQGDLDMANDSLDRLFKIYSQEAEQEYNFKTEQRKMVYEFLTAEQKRKMDKIQLDENRAYQETQDLHQEQTMYAKMAFETGQSSLGAKIAGLDYKSPNFKNDLSSLTSKIVDTKRQLEIQKLQNDLENSGSTINPKVLNTTQFKAAQAAQNLKLTLEKAQAAVKKYGNREVLSGEGAGILNSLKVQLRSEISTALEQGVVVPGEAAAFDQIAGQINKSFFIRNKKTLSSLASLANSMDNRIALQRAAITNTYKITPDQVDTLLNITNLSDQEFADMDAIVY